MKQSLDSDFELLAMIRIRRALSTMGTPLVTVGGCGSSVKVVTVNRIIPLCSSQSFPLLHLLLLANLIGFCSCSTRHLSRSPEIPSMKGLLQFRILLGEFCSFIGLVNQFGSFPSGATHFFLLLPELRIAPKRGSHGSRKILT